MKKRKKILIFISLLAFSVLINIIPLFVFKDKFAISERSYSSFFPIIIMILVSINGITAYFLRHKCNLLEFELGLAYRVFLIFSDDQDYTFTEKYINNFYWDSLIYWFAVSFYIPCIFFISEWWHKIIWTFCVYSAPHIIYLILGIFDIAKDVKEYRLNQQKQAQELKEQMAREEMGRFR